MKLSIIIPTLNEEKYLPKLLKSIKSQNFDDYEIIIADGNSTDNTQSIAKRFGCKVVAESKGKKGHPSLGRNLGAKKAQGDYLLFLDSDVILPAHFLRDAIHEFNQRSLVIGAARIVPLSHRLTDKILFGFDNLFNVFMQHIKPFAPGMCLMSKKSIHVKIKGFNENLYLCEDHDYANRASRFGKFGILHTTYVLVSMRRYDKEGRFSIAWRYFQSALLYILGLNNLQRRITYSFGKF